MLVTKGINCSKDADVQAVNITATAIAKEIGKPELLSCKTTLLNYISYLCHP